MYFFTLIYLLLYLKDIIIYIIIYIFYLSICNILFIIIILYDCCVTYSTVFYCILYYFNCIFVLLFKILIVYTVILCFFIINMNNHIYSTLLKIQERKADRISKEIEQRKKSQNTHIKQGRTCDLTALTLNYLAASMA